MKFPPVTSCNRLRPPANGFSPHRLHGVGTGGWPKHLSTSVASGCPRPSYKKINKYSLTRDSSPERRSALLAENGGLGGRGVATSPVAIRPRKSRRGLASATHGGDALACHVRRAVGCVAGAACCRRVGSASRPRSRAVRAPLRDGCGTQRCDSLARVRCAASNENLSARRHGGPVVPKHHA
jgi:hypothetical protein